MARISIAWELGGGMGHLLPMRSLTNVLLSRGHHVHLVVREVAKAEDIFRDIGVFIEQAPIYRRKQTSRFALAHSFSELLLAEGLEDVDDQLKRCIMWREIIDREVPDYLLCDHSPSAMLAARGRSLPIGTLGTGFCCPAQQTPLPNWRAWQNGAPYDVSVSEAIAADHLNQVLIRLDASTVRQVSEIYSDTANQFLQTYPELDHFPARLNGDYFGIPPLEPGVPVTWPPGLGKRIFAYLKRSRFTVNIIKHLALLRMPTLVYGPGLAEDLIAYCRNSFPAIQFETNPIDLNAVADSCDMVVHHGTHGTAAAFLLAGKPALVFPIQLEQTLTGIRLQELGVGRMANPNQDVDIINGLHQVLVSEHMTENARRFASRYTTWNPATMLTRIVDQIEQKLSSNA